jgi:glycosyltransferase involved in cell wall biosynthesis
MLDKYKISVILPAYNVKKHIEATIRSLPEFIDMVIIVDDKCPQNTGEYANSLNLDKVSVIFHKKNKGVGGAVITGYRKSIEECADIMVKMDGDNQMDPSMLRSLIQPIIDNTSDYTKGNRFRNFQELRKMPKARLFGNSALSFMVKIASGYWNIMDPTNGYTAINRKSLHGLNLHNISERYFFESDMLINLNIENCVVQDVSIPARYGEEESSLSIMNTIYTFPFKILKGLFKRVFYKYFLYDFNMASIYMIVGLPMIFFGVIYGTYSWYSSSVANIDTATGTVMLSVLPIMIGVQFLLQAISIDIGNVPKK